MLLVFPKESITITAFVLNLSSGFTQSQVPVLSLLHTSNHVLERATDNKTVKSFNHKDKTKT